MKTAVEDGESGAELCSALPLKSLMGIVRIKIAAEKEGEIDK